MSDYLIVSGDFRVTGGMDMANYALAGHLADRGSEVHLVAHHVADDLAARPRIRVHRVPKVGRSYLLSGPLLDHAGRLRARGIARRGGRVVVNGGNCRWGDVNWVHYVHAAYHPGARAGGRLRRLKGRVERPTFLRDERLALRRARLVIANSRRTRDDLIEHLGLSESAVVTVYYGIDPGRFGLVTPEERAGARAELGWPIDRPHLAFVGALGDRRKGLDVAFDAWRILCRDGDWDARLMVIGAGGELDDWRRRVADAGLGGRLEFLGFRRDVPRLLAACDALIHPSRYEAYGLGVHEALCRGLPALVSASAGVAERFPDDLRPLLLPDPEDAGDLAARLRDWRDDIESIRARVASFADALRGRTWDDMAAEIVGRIEGG